MHTLRGKPEKQHEHEDHKDQHDADGCPIPILLVDEGLVIGRERPDLGAVQRTAVGNQHDIDVVRHQTQRLPHDHELDVAGDVGDDNLPDDLPLARAIDPRRPELVFGNRSDSAGKDDRPIGQSNHHLDQDDDNHRVIGDPVGRAARRPEKMDDLVDESVLRGIEIPEPKDGIDDRRGDHRQHDDGLEQARPCVATDEIGGHDRNEQVKQDDQYHGAEDIDQRVCQDQPVIRIQENLLVVGEPDELPLEGGIQSGEGHDDCQDGRKQIKQ